MASSTLVVEVCEVKAVYLVIEGLTRPSDVAARIEAEEVRVLNCAGNRESVSPGIGARVERFLVAVLRQLPERR